MAKKVNVVLVDDIDGTEAERTVRFAFEGTSYEIDLSEKNYQEFLTVLEPWIEAARKGNGRASSARGGKSGAAQDTAAVRAWAKEQGHQVSERGRVSAELIRLYRETH